MKTLFVLTHVSWKKRYSSDSCLFPYIEYVRLALWTVKFKKLMYLEHIFNLAALRISIFCLKILLTLSPELVRLNYNNQN
jgi:hypothetical protein